MKKRVTLRFIREVVSILTPSEQEYIRSQLRQAPAAIAQVLKPLLYERGKIGSQAYSIPNKSSSQANRQALRWLLKQLILYHFMSSYRQMVYHFAIVFFLKERNTEIGTELQRFIEQEIGLEDWLNEFNWYNVSLFLRIERAFLNAYLGYLSMAQIPAILGDATNELPVMGATSLLEKALASIVSELRYLDLQDPHRKELASILQLVYEIYQKTHFRVDTSSSSLQFVYNISIFMVLAKRLSYLPSFFKILFDPCLRELLPKMSMAMLGQVLFATAFVLAYAPLAPDGLQLTRQAIEIVQPSIARLIGHVKQMKQDKGLAHSRILMVVFLAIKAVALHQGFTLNFQDYIALSRISYINSFYRLQLIVTLIATHFYNKDYRKAYRRYLPLLEQLARNFRIIRLAYYLWKFMLEYEMEDYPALINTAHAAYQWNRREKMPFGDIVLWMKKYSVHLHYFTKEIIWRQALNEVLNIYMHRPSIVSVEEFCPFTKWLQQKANLGIDDSDTLKRIEASAVQQFPIPFLDEYARQSMHEWLNTVVDSYHRLCVMISDSPQHPRS